MRWRAFPFLCRADGDFLQVRVGEGGVVVGGFLGDPLDALGRYRHALRCAAVPAAVPLRDTPADIPRSRPVTGALFRDCRDTEGDSGMAGRARAVPVRMAVKRDRKLRQVIAAGTSPQRLVLRARIVLAAAAGGRERADRP